MINLTKPQRRALYQVYKRGPDYLMPNSYRQFRKTIEPEIAGHGAVMIHWQGMWLGIELDGHTHS